MGVQIAGKYSDFAVTNSGTTNPNRSSVGDRWGVRPGVRVWVGGHNVDAKREIERHLAGLDRPPTGAIDLAFIAPLTVDEAVHFAGKLVDRLSPNAVIWALLWQQAAQDHASATHLDVGELIGTLRELSYVPVATVEVSPEFQSVSFRYTKT